MSMIDEVVGVADTKDIPIRMAAMTTRQRDARSGEDRQSCLSWRLNGTNAQQ